MPLDTIAGQGTSRPIIPERFEAATVANDTDPDADLFVSLESLPEQLTGPIKGWQARSTPVLRGDRCLVARVGDGDYWFLTWDLPGWSGAT